MRATANSAGTYPSAAPAGALSKVKSSELVMGLDLPGIDGGGDAAVSHHIGTARQFERERRFLLDQHHRQTLVVEPPQRLQDLYRHLGREPERGLVEQQQLR